MRRMGRIFTGLGIVAIVLGIVGAVAGAFLPTQIGAFIPNITANESQLCQPGEKLVKETGASSYTPGQGWGSAVQYYCVNDAGTRRDVTGQFAQGLVGQIFGALPGVASGMMFSLGATCVLLAGVVLLVTGRLMSRRRAEAYSFDLGGGVSGQVVTVQRGQPAQFSTVVTTTNQADLPPDMQRFIEQVKTNPAKALSEFSDDFEKLAGWAQANAANLPTDLTGRLKQLEEARQVGLISQAEYDQLRRDILDSLT